MPTLTVTVVEVVAVITSDFRYAGSVTLGYGCKVALSSNAHLNVIPLAAISSASPTLKLCVPIVTSNTPLAGAYVAPVGVNCAAALPFVITVTFLIYGERVFTKPPAVKLNACPGLKKSLIVISSITTSSSNKNALLLCVATVGLIIVFLMSSLLVYGMLRVDDLLHSCHYLGY
jgi:hypothetical protein